MLSSIHLHARQFTSFESCPNFDQMQDVVFTNTKKPAYAIPCKHDNYNMQESAGVSCFFGKHSN